MTRARPRVERGRGGLVRRFSWKMSFPYSMDHDSSEAREKERVPVKKLVLDIKWSKYSLFSFREYMLLLRPLENVDIIEILFLIIMYIKIDTCH